MINPAILHPALYSYHLPSQRLSQRERQRETIANSRYCSSGYFLEKISSCGKQYSDRDVISARRVFCGAFPLKGYRRPKTF